MQGTQFFDYFRNAIIFAFMTFALSGCLMGEKKAKSDGEIEADHLLSGSVGDGPIVAASISVNRSDGQRIAQLHSDSSASYSIMVRTKGMYYPLTIDARGGTDLVTGLAPDFDLSGAVFRADNDSIANVNPFSTFAVEVARDLPGGITADNLSAAESYVVHELNSGLTSLAVSGPMRSRIDLTNVAEIVKASETLAETVRRTRDLLRTFGRASSGDQVVGEIASDLSDRIIDGRGGPRTNARTSAIATVVAAQVFMEAMQNELRVNGQDAMAAMASAIDQVTTSAPVRTIEQQRVSREMVDAIRIGLDACIAVDATPGLVPLRQAVDGVQTGMDPLLVRTLVPDDYRQTLDAVLITIAGGDDAMIDTINDIARAGGSEGPPANRAPTISGTPGTSIRVGASYSFTPTASDIDGDSVTFSVSGLPAWTSFDTATGRISGTPDAGDVGTYGDIVIGASDGQASNSLPPFTIAVTTTNSAPTITGTPRTSIMAGAPYSFTPGSNDPDGDVLTFDISGQPLWASFDTSNGRLNGTPGAADVGIHGNIVISVTDGRETISLAAFEISVSGANAAPTISGTPSNNVDEGDSYQFTPTASDPDGDTLIFSVSGLPAWASFDTATGRISGTPAATDVRTYGGIRITVSDGRTSASLGPFAITVTGTSLWPVTLDWTPPTQNEDGSALVDLAGYTIYWGPTLGNYPNSVTINNPGLSSYVVDNVVSGTYVFAAKSFNASGVESAYSNAVTKSVP